MQFKGLTTRPRGGYRFNRQLLEWAAQTSTYDLRAAMLHSAKAYVQTPRSHTARRAFAANLHMSARREYCRRKEERREVLAAKGKLGSSGPRQTEALGIKC